MSYQPVSKILEFITRQHLEASEACARAADNVPAQSRDSLLLKRLETFESEVYKRLKDQEGNTSQEVRETWIQYVPTETVNAALERLRTALTVEITERLIALHQAITEFVKTISEQVSSEQVSEFFSSLTEVEENYSRQCAMEQLRENEV